MVHYQISFKEQNQTIVFIHSLWSHRPIQLSDVGNNTTDT